MQRFPIQSSMLRSVGYDPQSKTLETEFNNGRIHQYMGVPQDVYAAVLRDSAGQVMRQAVIGNYQENRLR